MVDLELDDSWLGDSVVNRIEPVRLRKQEPAEPKRETQSEPEPPTVAPIREEPMREEKIDTPEPAASINPIEQKAEPVAPDLPQTAPIREIPDPEKPVDKSEPIESTTLIEEETTPSAPELPKTAPMREKPKPEPEAANVVVPKLPPAEPVREQLEPGLRGELTMPTAVVQAQRAAPEKPLEAVVVDTVGEVPPVVLGAGIIGGLLLFIVLAVIGVLVIMFGNFSFSPLPDDPIIEQFDNDASEIWPTQRITDDSSTIIQEAYFEDGGYRITNKVPATLIWSSAGLRLGDGTYQVDIEFANDEAETGAGLAVLQEEDTFFLVEIGPDGFAWIGRCEQGCATAEPLVGNGWFAVENINQGLGQTNQLTVEVMRGQMVVLVNGTEIGFVDDSRIRGAGDVALLVESGNSASVSAVFDNFEWTP